MQKWTNLNLHQKYCCLTLDYGSLEMRCCWYTGLPLTVTPFAQLPGAHGCLRKACARRPWICDYNSPLPCPAGKQHRVAVPQVALHCASAPLQLVHSDMHGPLPVRSRYQNVFSSMTPKYSPPFGETCKVISIYLTCAVWAKGKHQH